MNVTDFWGLIFTSFWLCFVNIGGIGGGGSMITVSLAFFSFSQKEAIALSNLSVFTASLIRYLMNSRKPHPLKNGKGLIIDLNMLVVMLPMIVSGASFGVIANVASPNPVIIGSLCLITCISGSSLFLKLRMLLKKENAEI
jgi:uncharacterized membrane protein YfcA